MKRVIVRYKGKEDTARLIIGKCGVRPYKPHMQEVRPDPNGTYFRTSSPTACGPLSRRSDVSERLSS
jgi:hypothetical protein